MREHLFLIIVTAAVLCITLITVRFTLQARAAQSTTWESLVKRIMNVNQDNVASIALDIIQENGQRRTGTWPELDAEQIWELSGGMDGLERIEANCQVFIEMAVYLQQYYPEAVVIAEEFRRNTRHVQWHINRLRTGVHAGNLPSTFADYAQRAVASYFLMSKQLVEICERLDFAGLEQLRASV